MKRELLIAGVILAIVKLSSAQSGNTSQPELIIKTVVAKGSVRMNEFGNHSDWLEIYNTTNRSIDLSEEDYFISDNPKRKRKFKLRKGIIPAESSIVVWCDDEGRFKEQIHANFKLSSFGETLTISKSLEKKQVIVDEIAYSALEENGQRALIRQKDTLKLMPVGTEEFDAVSSR